MTPTENILIACTILQRKLGFVPALCPFCNHHLSFPFIFLHSHQIIIFFFFPNSCFFPWGLEYCLFRLMCVTGSENWNERWLHANESSPLILCFTLHGNQWWNEWRGGLCGWVTPSCAAVRIHGEQQESIHLHLHLSGLPQTFAVYPLPYFCPIHCFHPLSVSQLLQISAFLLSLSELLTFVAAHWCADTFGEVLESFILPMR